MKNQIKKWVVRFCDNVTAYATFNEHTHSGSVSKTLETHRFSSFEEAEKFYLEGKNFLRFAGGAGHYYTYPTQEEGDQ